MANIPLFRGVADRAGCSAPSPMPSHSGRGGQRMGCSLPHPCPLMWERGGQRMGNIPLFRGVADRTGCSAPSPMLSHSGRGVAKDGVFGSPHPCPLIVGEGWPKDGNIPLFRGVADRTGCSLPALVGLPIGRGVRLPHPCPLIVGEGWARMGSIPLFRGVADRMGNIPLFRGVSDRTGCSLSPHALS